MKRLIEKQEVEQYAGLNNPDIRSKYLNIRNGWRKSWSPPARGCSPTVVWMFGGSAAFGQQQRDTHTIASEISKRAWVTDRRNLVVRNGGVHGYVAWQEQLQLDKALAVEASPPDAVIFYDGFNDFIAQNIAQQSGMSGPGTLRSLNDANVLRLMTRMKWIERDGRLMTEAVVPTDPRRPTNLAESVNSTLWQYEQAQKWATERLGARKIPWVRFFQPGLATKSPRAAAEGTPSAPLERAFAEVRKHLPAGVVDLSDVLNNARSAVFVDDVHTTEAANVDIAGAIYERLAPILPPRTEPCS